MSSLPTISRSMQSKNSTRSAPAVRVRPALVFNKNVNQLNNPTSRTNNQSRSSYQSSNRIALKQPLISSDDVELGQSQCHQSTKAVTTMCYRKRLAILIILPMVGFTLAVLAITQYLPSLWSISSHPVNQSVTQTFVQSIPSIKQSVVQSLRKDQSLTQSPPPTVEQSVEHFSITPAQSVDHPHAKSATHSAALQNSQSVIQTNIQPTHQSPNSHAKSTATLLAPYITQFQTPIQFHNPFFNEPYARDRRVPEHDDSITHSNRALPHQFPTPLPFVPKMFGREVVIGAMCYNLARIQVLLDTWGKYTDNLYIFSEQQPDEEANIKQSQLHQVIVMNNSMNAHRHANDRRASAWKVLPILEHLYRAQPLMEWFYIIDDDSFPVIPQVIDYTHNFYAHNPTYSPSEPIYIGQSVTKHETIKPYYADDEPLVLKKPLRYFCTGGGVLMNKQLVHSVAPQISKCPVTFASDLTLGYCIQTTLPNVTMIEMDSPYILWARTIDEVTNIYRFDESAVWKAAGFHHMREPFIGNSGIDMRLEAYLRESEMRTYSHYLYRVHELGAPGAQSADMSNLRTLVISSCDTSTNELLNTVASLLSTGLAPMAALSRIGFDTDLICSGQSSTSMFQHVQNQLHHKTSESILLKDAQLEHFEKFADYSLVLLSGLPIPSRVIESYSGVLFATFDSPQQLSANVVRLSPNLIGLDEPLISNTVTMPRDMLYYGVWHSLFSGVHKSHITVQRDLYMFWGGAATDAISVSGIPSNMVASFDETTPPLELIGKFMTSKLCIFAGNETTEAIARRIHWSIAAGCLAIVSSPVADSFGIKELLSSRTIISPSQPLPNLLRQYSFTRSYGSELGYQRFALNAHFCEKPIHQLATMISSLAHVKQ